MSSISEAREKWFDHVKETFEAELKKDIDSNVCVFQVPNSLSSAKPEAYTPQLVGLGPYHHLRPQLREMERVKLDVVKKLHKVFHSFSFDELEKLLRHLDPYVHVCYHKFLDMDDDMLSWIMTVDALFLFDLLCRHGIDKKTLESSSGFKGLADQVGKKLAEDAILRDVMMLENQIPIFFVEKMLIVVCAPLKVPERIAFVEGLLSHILEGFCKALSPLKETIKYPDDAKKALKRAHLLDLLYSMVVTRENEFKIDIPAHIINIEDEDMRVGNKMSVVSEFKPVFKEAVSCYSLVSTAENWILPAAPVMQGLTHLYHQLSSYLDSSGDKEAPAEEKALIPTASSLSKAGVKFIATRHIHETSFEEKTHTFLLPAIKLGVNSEVVIRNLVAYEAMAISETLVFAHFMELMDSLIDTLDDVKLLKNEGIITSNLKDDEVMHLFNGLSDSIKVNGDHKLDETIRKAKAFYNDAPNIKTQKMIERYVYSAWKVLAMVAVVLFFLLMALQTFCSAYHCSSLVNKTN
ncbi:hypothetical protein NL676_023632 [Syzygium grande]|nr:hypothetical protein NL676_023632 [Syzygium grande]